MRAFITAIRTLSLLPCPGRETDDLAAALPFFPVIGALLGGLFALCGWGLAACFDWPAGAAVVVVALMAFLTRGLHLDGLGDTIDALGGGHTRERRLQIMKDPHIGTFGVVAIVAVILLKTVAVGRILGFAQWGALITPLVLSRMAMVRLATSLPYARTEGGTAQAFVQNARGWHWAAAVCLAALFSYAASGTIGLLLLAVAILFALGLRQWMRTQFGGVTGDLLGMANELIETLLFMILAMVAPALQRNGLLFLT